MTAYEITFTKPAWNGTYSANIVNAETAEQATAYYTAQGYEVAGCEKHAGSIKPGQPVETVPEDWEPEEQDNSETKEQSSNEITEEGKTMNENRIYMSIEEKINGKYQEIRRVTDPAEVEHDLMHDLIAKKLHSCTYIKSIKDRTNYDGTRTITVTYTNNVRRIYRIEF